MYQFSFFPQVVQLRWRGGTGKSDFAIEPQIGHSACHVPGPAHRDQTPGT